MSIVRALSRIAPENLIVKNEDDSPPHDSERRESPRHVCQVEAYCQPLADHAGSRWPATAVDISTRNVSLVLSRRFEAGTLLAVGLQGTTAGDCMPLVRVQRVAPDGVYWRIGCVWSDPLTPEELRGLVGSATAG